MAETVPTYAADSELTAPAGQSPVVPYEQSLARDVRWAMSEGSLFFEGKGRVQRSLVRIARQLHELQIPYAVAGGMALFAHGHRRFTEDIDILISRDSLERVHEALDGRGWVRPFSKSRNLRDADTGVRIKFLIAGDYPGDGKPKPVQFPVPDSAAVEIDGIKYVALPKFIELKLASGMTGGVHRAKDLVDVGELTTALNLPESLADSLDPFVGPTYQKLWRDLHGEARRYVMTQQDAGDRIDEMLADGLTLENLEKHRTGPLLVTNDPGLAKKYGMVEESEFFE